MRLVHLSMLALGAANVLVGCRHHPQRKWRPHEHLDCGAGGCVDPTGAPLVFTAHPPSHGAPK